jgi:hypothetical protein
MFVHIKNDDAEPTSALIRVGRNVLVSMGRPDVPRVMADKRTSWHSPADGYEYSGDILPSFKHQKAARLR